MTLRAGLVAAEGRALEGLPGLPVDHGELDLLIDGRVLRTAQLELGMTERVEGDEHVVALADPLLAAAHLGVLVVEDLAPVAVVLRVARVRPDPVDREVLEAGEPLARPREPCLAAGIVEGGEQSGTGLGVRVRVGAVALVRAAAVVAVELVSVRLHPAVEERLRLSFDAHVDRDGRVVRACGRGCERTRDGEDREAQEPSSHWISLPFREGFVAVGRRQVSWLPVSPGRAFPGSGAPQWPWCGWPSRSQWRDRAGFAPDFPRTTGR